MYPLNTINWNSHFPCPCMLSRIWRGVTQLISVRNYAYICFFDTPTLQILYLMIKMTNFRGSLADILAETKTLVSPPLTSTLIYGACTRKKMGVKHPEACSFHSGTLQHSGSLRICLSGFTGVVTMKLHCL